MIVENRYISAVGGYLPLLRLDRRAAAKALASTGLGLPKKGVKAAANWDEDALTMAVEAARPVSRAQSVDEVVFASTSAFFTERQQAAIMVDALNLPRDIRTQDVANSRRAAVSELLRALLGGSNSLLCVGERRATTAGSPQNLNYGDGAAACLVSDSGGAKLLGFASRSFDFVDTYASVDRRSPYQYEARFIRDVAVEQVIAPAIQQACDNAGVTAADIDYAVIPEPSAGAYRVLAKALGLQAKDVAGDLHTNAGDLGAAHSLFALGLALGQAKLGDTILLCGFGGGCDALVLKYESEVRGASELQDYLNQGVVFYDYLRFLNLHGALDIDWGMRAEFVQKAQGSVLARKGRDMMGFVGGRDSEGNVQFPKSPLPVNPKLKEPQEFTDVPLADELGKVVSCTADRLSYCPDPPFAYGLVQFDNGARVMMEFADTNGRPPQVGEQVRMRFRIKSKDGSRGFRTYFWKAAPKNRSCVEAS